jgi:hypothetical protein
MENLLELGKMHEALVARLAPFEDIDQETSPEEAMIGDRAEAIAEKIAEIPARSLLELRAAVDVIRHYRPPLRSDYVEDRLIERLLSDIERLSDEDSDRDW